MGTLKDFCTAHGLTLEQAAVNTGRDPRLYVSVDRMRQPLPLQACTELAQLAGVELVEAQVAAFWWTARGDSVVFNPVPPRIGEPFE